MITAQPCHDRGVIEPGSRCDRAAIALTTSAKHASRSIRSGMLDGPDCVHQCHDVPHPRHRLLCPFDEDHTLSEASMRRHVIAEIVIDHDHPMKPCDDDVPRIDRDSIRAIQ